MSSQSMCRRCAPSAVRDAALASLKASIASAGGIVLCALLATGLAALAGSAAAADDLIVTYDQSQILKLPQPALNIIVGNPSVIDVSVQNGTTLVITGKTFGVTNLIALDAGQNVITERRVFVNREEAKVVNLLRGSKRQSYNCTPQCNPSITIGDEPNYFDTLTSASQKKVNFSEHAAEPSASNAP